MLSVHNKSGGTLNTEKSRMFMYTLFQLKKNNDNDNEKLQYLPKSLIFQKYKKYSPAKYALLLYLTVSIRSVSIMFDAKSFNVFIAV